MTAAVNRSGSPNGTGAASYSLSPLLDAVASGDSSALRQLYTDTAAKVYGICLRLLGSEAEAEEVLQDVYVTVWNKASQFDGNKASPITWLCVLARNKAIDRLRRRTLPQVGLDAAAEVEDDRASALEVLEADEERGRLFECLDELEEQQRSAVRSAFLDGVTYRDLAERESVPLGTMKSWIRRSLIRLRGCLEQ